MRAFWEKIQVWLFNRDSLSEEVLSKNKKLMQNK